MFSFKHQAFRCSCMKDMIHGNVDYHRERFFSGVVTELQKSRAKAKKLGKRYLITTFWENDP